MNSFGRLIVIFIVVFLLILKPLQYGADIQDTINEERAKSATQEFIHKICNSNELTKEDYETFLLDLSETGAIYTIDMKIGGVLEENTATFTSKIMNAAYFNQAEINTLSVSTIHNNHNDDCYFGTQHICSEYGGSCYTYRTTWVSHSHDSSCYMVHNHSWSTYIVDQSCFENRDCGNNKWVDRHYTYADCSGCGATYTVSGYATCTGCNRYYTVGPYSAPVSTSTLICTLEDGYLEEYYDKSCGMISGYFYDNGSDETDDPKCDRVVISIEPELSLQVVELGQSISNKCIATFLDGHQALIECSSNYQSAVGFQNITLSYQGLLYWAKNTEELNTTAIVKTLLFFECPVCDARYESNENGEDLGCPVCNNTLLGIRVTAIKTNYDVGEMIQLEVIAIYKDYEIEVTDWTSNYNAYISGEQTVTVHYQALSGDINVIVKNNVEKVCPECGEIYDTEMNPSCPYCSNEISYITAYIEKNELEIGEDLSLYIIVTYKDGHQEYYGSGFEITGYDKYTKGIQQVKVTYKDHEDSFTVNVVEDENQYKMCDNEHVYLLSKDGSDQGCPLCVFENEVSYRYIDVVYHEQLLSELYENGKLIFEAGDYISIQVTYKTSALGKVKDTILMRNTSYLEKSYVYGGKII